VLFHVKVHPGLGPLSFPLPPLAPGHSSPPLPLFPFSALPSPPAPAPHGMVNGCLEVRLTSPFISFYCLFYTCLFTFLWPTELAAGAHACGARRGHERLGSRLHVASAAPSGLSTSFGLHVLGAGALLPPLRHVSFLFWIHRSTTTRSAPFKFLQALKLPVSGPLTTCLESLNIQCLPQPGQRLQHLQAQKRGGGENRLAHSPHCPKLLQMHGAYARSQVSTSTASKMMNFSAVLPWCLSLHFLGVYTPAEPGGRPLDTTPRLLSSF